MQNDLIFISHDHDPTDSFIKLESGPRQIDGDGASAPSMLDRSATSLMGQKDQYAAFSEQVRAPSMQHHRQLMRLPRN